MTAIIYYHENCVDGFMSATIARRVYPDALFVPYNFKRVSLEESVSPDRIICLDCVVPEADMYGCLVAVIDHHEGNKEKISELQIRCEQKKIPCEIWFSEDKCGALLTWEWFFPHESLPFPINYIDDRDRWQWKLENSKEINEYIKLQPFTFEAYEQMFKTSIVEMTIAGKTLLQNTEQECQRILKNKHLIFLADRWMPAVNSPIHMSELGHLLSEPFGCVYHFDGEEYKVAIRSIGENNCIPIAQFYGGGGHKNAAGCSVKSLLMKKG